MAEKGRGRTRNFASIVYPESAPENWMEILADTKVPCFISPLHDKDINPGGEKKKDHYHVIIMFDSVKTIEQALELFKTIGAVEYVEQIQSIRGYARYLCHLDNPEKAQYEIELVRCYGGADYISTIGLATDKYKAISEMIDFCEENDIYSYSDLLRLARYERYDWFRILCDCGTVVMKEYLYDRSRFRGSV